MRDKRSLILGICLLFLSLVSTGSLEADTLDVCASSCTYSTIQSAINAATSGVDDVLVYSGTYVENINFSGKAITVRTTEGAIIDGNQDGTVVTFDQYEGPTSILKGFTIQNGWAQNPNSGGGIFCWEASPKIDNCTIFNNRANYGGGISFLGSSAEIINSVISSNTSDDEGGGIHLNLSGTTISQATITNCTVNDNSAYWYGGGIFGDNGSTATITNCTVDGNESLNDRGGGIYLKDMPGKNIVTGCTITNNIANNDGGGVVSESGALEITNCVISGNSVSNYMGGGIFCSYSTSTITNCFVTGNVADDGGGINCHDSSAEIINTSISGNHAATDGGGIYSYGNSSTTVVNSILWGNTAVTNGQEVYLYGAGDAITITFSDINSAYIAGSGSTTLSNNINTDPLFADSHPASEAPTTAGNYHLSESSSCIDSATSSGAPSDDIDGDSRPRGEGYDMGADEVYCPDADGDGYYSESGCGTSVDCDDADPDINPGACDIKKNGIDEDCDGQDRTTGPPC